MEKIFKQAEIVAREWAESNIRRNVTKFTFDEEYEICIRLYLSYNIEVEVKQNGFAGYQEYEQKMESIYQQFKRWRDEERRNYAEPFVKRQSAHQRQLAGAR
ncbi:hypothetical protein [Kroppenstedtia eburnea]|uniref:Uncharacterized protein n=1 Tax=Kroppenstedtia eburnea TaxID=714067 RepID=A0A1N7JFL4_9BACL|nr:hypothetical protein [Kroppenstedtia eburnea]QKI80597.1 hypothetical protein GXN75_00370 [Kroppenstedtia eburnea]SIS48034.1 hypothetical protein SAMN05421790_10227 [Kroppenstedtia eburnea]